MEGRSSRLINMSMNRSAVTWENPNANNKSDSCRYSWKWDGVTKEHGDQNDYNVDYYRCVRDGAEFFQYYFQGMVDYTSFGMRMSHKFLDTRYVSDLHPGS